MDILVILVRHRRLICILVLLGCLAGGASLLGPIIARAESSTMYHAGLSALLYDPVADPNGLVRTLAESEEVQSAARTAAQSAGGKYVEFSLAARYDTNSRRLSLEASATSPESASAAVQASLDALREAYAKLEGRRVPRPAGAPAGPLPEVLPAGEPVPFDLVALGKPVILPPSKPSTKTFALILLTSLFIAFLAAFVANAWDRLRNDEESMKRLKAAGCDQRHKHSKA